MDCIEPEEKNKSAGTGSRAQQMPPHLPKLIKIALTVTGSLCAAAALLYTFSGSMSDSAIFLVLKMMRYASFTLVLFSFSALIFSVNFMVRKPCFKQVMFMALYTLLGMAGVFLVFLNDLIVALSEGNG
jgi:hypothetical protein